MKFGFYVIGKKGYAVLETFFATYGSDCVAYVECRQDEGILKDWYFEIKSLAELNRVSFVGEGGRGGRPAQRADWSFAIGWKWMIPEQSRLIVFHDSLLPKYRGFAPLVNMLIDGRLKAGVTALRATDAYDQGPILAQRAIDITYPKKISDAIDDLIPVYCDLVARLSRRLLAGEAVSSAKQKEDQASYSLWRDEEDYLVDWRDSSFRLKRFIDAVGTPYRGAAAVIGEKSIRIFDAEVEGDVAIENRSAHIGKTIFMRKKNPVVVCGRGLLRLTDLRSESGEYLDYKVAFRTRFKGKDDGHYPI
ncbi:methionyl-tRNA formyltransferase-like protein [Salinisphaera sp. S4-8]|uniref:methionyl-tRNA formyltransferase n=1 Tax=Salinisphaera sp. S4-8 TaxID=633357 RepID=UPI0033424A53